MKNKVISKVMVFLLLAVLVYSKPTMAQAAEPNLVPALADGQKSSLTITLSYQNDDKQTVNLSGQELTVYEVAALTVTNGSASYDLTEEFNATGINFEGMTIEQSKEYAKELEKTAAEVTGTSKTTDEKGMVSFEGLDPGMYLVTFKQKTNQDKIIYTMDSFLISAPSVEVQNEENVWNYEVKTEPKFAINLTKVPTPTPTATPVTTPVPSVTPSYIPQHTPTATTPVTPPKTGDDTNVVFWWCMFGGALLGLVLLIVPFTKHQKNK